MAIRRRNILAECLAVGLLAGGGAARSADNLIFVPLAPCRVIDTRVPGAGGPLAAGTPRTFIFRGPTLNYQNPAPLPNQGGSTTGCGIADLTSNGGTEENLARAVAINIVAVGPAGAGDLRAWAANRTVPLASVINYNAVPGLNIANGIIVPMCDEVSLSPCASGDITFEADVSGTHLVVDVVGYFHPGSTEYTLNNAAFGHGALLANTTGTGNTAIGRGALAANTSGNDETASGAYALWSNTSGPSNTAFGYVALFTNTTGGGNTALGQGALRYNTTGSRNVAIGSNAGLFATTGSDNIFIGGNLLGVAGENATVEIGSVQTRAFIAGIRGTTTANNDAIPVLIDSAGQLGTVSSSRRFKQDIEDVGEASERVLDLRPVRFRYREQAARGDTTPQFGLIAEEVAEVFPELVVYDHQGQPETVKYHLLVPLLLGALEREHRVNETQEASLRAQGQEMEDQRREIEALKARVTALDRVTGAGMAPRPTVARPAPGAPRN